MLLRNNSLYYFRFVHFFIRWNLYKFHKKCKSYISLMDLFFKLTRLHKFNILTLFYLAPFSFLFIFHLISRSIFFLFLFIYIFLSSDTRYSISNLEKLRCQKIIFVGLIYLFGKKKSIYLSKNINNN